MATDTIPTRSYHQLQDFKQLTSLTIAGDLVNTLTDLCGMVDYSQLKELTVYLPAITSYDYSIYSGDSIARQEQFKRKLSLLMNKQESATTITASTTAARRTTTTYPNIYTLRLYGYNILSMKQQ